MTLTLGPKLPDLEALQLGQVTDEVVAEWLDFGEYCRHEPAFLPFVEETDPALFDEIVAGFGVLAIEARYLEWRSDNPDVGGRAAQLLPGTPGSFSDRTDWAVWLLMGGRGSGKSRTGAEALRELLFGQEWIDHPQVALVSRTLEQVRLDMVERILLQVFPEESVIKWNRSACELYVQLPNGRVAFLKGYAAEAKDKLRGPNFHLCWADEISSWPDARTSSPNTTDSAWSNMKMAVRLDDQETKDPKVIATTTPKSGCTLLRNVDPNNPRAEGEGLVDDPMTVVSAMSTEENRANLSAHFWDTTVEPLRGTRLWAQEVLGELIDEDLGAQWDFDLIQSMRVPTTYPHRQATILRTVVSVDPSVGEGLGDECGITVAALCDDGNVYILADLSFRGSAKRWAERVAAAFQEWEADTVVVEVNQGGELVRQTLGRYASNLPVRDVRAKKGKLVRAEPVAVLSEAGRVFLAGRFERLEYQMRTWDGEGDESPDRLDAFVYAVLHLLPVETGAGRLITTRRPVGR